MRPGKRRSTCKVDSWPTELSGLRKKLAQPASAGPFLYRPPKRPGNFGGRRSKRLSRSGRVGPTGRACPIGSGRVARRFLVPDKGFWPALRGRGDLRGIFAPLEEMIMGPKRPERSPKGVRSSGPLSGCSSQKRVGIRSGGLRVLVHCWCPPPERHWVTTSAGRRSNPADGVTVLHDKSIYGANRALIESDPHDHPCFWPQIP